MTSGMVCMMTQFLLPPQPRPTQGLLSLPQPAKPCQMTARATVTLLSDGDSSGSQTGSSDGLIADITHIRTPPLLGIPVHSPHRPVGGGKFEQGSLLISNKSYFSNI